MNDKRRIVQHALNVLRYEAYDGDRFHCDLEHDGVIRQARSFDPSYASEIDLFQQSLKDSRFAVLLFTLLALQQIGNAAEKLQDDISHLLQNKSFRIRRQALNALNKTTRLATNRVKANLVQMTKNSSEHIFIRIHSFRLLAYFCHGYKNAIKEIILSKNLPNSGDDSV